MILTIEDNLQEKIPGTILSDVFFYMLIVYTYYVTGNLVNILKGIFVIILLRFAFGTVTSAVDQDSKPYYQISTKTAIVYILLSDLPWHVRILVTLTFASFDKINTTSDSILTLILSIIVNNELVKR